MCFSFYGRIGKTGDSHCPSEINEKDVKQASDLILNVQSARNSQSNGRRLACIRSNRIGWRNPRGDMNDYQPRCRSIQTALSSIDDLRSSNNLESLPEIEKMLNHAWIVRKDRETCTGDGSFCSRAVGFRKGGHEIAKNVM